MSNSRLTVVANPFKKPIEEVVSKLSYIPFIISRHKFFYGIAQNGMVIIPTEKTDSHAEKDFQTFKGRPKLRSADLYFLPGEEPFVHGFQIDPTNNFSEEMQSCYDINLSLNPNGWLVFNTSRTKIREILFQIYKMFADIHTFPKIEWNEYPHSLRMGISATDDILDDINIIPNALPKITTSRVIKGGGGGGNAITLLPVPPRNNTLDTIQAVLSWDTKHLVEGIITRHNYAYKFSNNIIVPWTGPNVAFMNLSYDCLVISRDVSASVPEQMPQDPNIKRITIQNGMFSQISGAFSFGPFSFESYKKKKISEQVKEFIAESLSLDADAYMHLYSDDEDAMYITRHYVVFIDPNFVKNIN